MADEQIRAVCDRALEGWDDPAGPGVALAVIEAGAPVHLAARGLADLEHRIPVSATTRFSIGAISNQFTGAVVALLARDGQLSLETGIREFIPELQPFADAITLETLLRHTSGLRDCFELMISAGWRNWDVMTQEDALELILRQRRGNFAPGTNWSFSNSDYVLLAEVLQRLTGKSLRTLLAELIFDPLEMRSTHVQDHARELVPDRARAYLRSASGSFKAAESSASLLGSGGVFTTLEDLCRWDANLHSGRVGGPGFGDLIATPGALRDGRPVGFGFGLFLGELEGRRLVEQAGQKGGSVAHYLRLPDDGLSVVVCANDFSTPVTAIVEDVVRGIRGTDRPLPRFRALPPIPGSRAVYRGRDSGMLTRIEIEHGKATLGFGGGPPEGHEPTDFVAGTASLDAIHPEGLILVAGNNDRELVTISPDASQLFLSSRFDPLVRVFDLVAAPGVNGGDRALGRFYAEELDMSLTAALVDGRLRLEGRRFARLNMEAVSPTAFAASGVSVEFEGDPDEPDTLLLSAALMWHVRFDRVPS